MASPTPIRTPSRRTEACAAGGFTLLELLVVMGLLSVLTGMAVGVLGRRDPHMIAASTIGGACRAATVSRSKCQFPPIGATRSWPGQ